VGLCGINVGIREKISTGCLSEVTKSQNGGEITNISIRAIPVQIRKLAEILLLIRKSLSNLTVDNGRVVLLKNYVSRIDYDNPYLHKA